MGELYTIPEWIQKRTNERKQLSIEFDLRDERFFTARISRKEYISSKLPLLVGTFNKEELGYENERITD